MSERPTRRVYTEADPDFDKWQAELDAQPEAPDDAPEAQDTPPPQPEATQQAPTETDWLHQELAAQPDAEIRYTDAEILGKRYPVRQAVRELGNQRMKAVEGVQARWNNALDTPGKLRRQFSVSIAEGRYNRHKAKLDAVSHLPDGSYLKRRRMAKLARAEGKLRSAKSALEYRVGRMERRTAAVGENSERRRAEYVRELKQRREAALARRTLRHELRAQGAGLLETRAILKDMPAEHKQRVGRVAAQAETSRRAFGQAERAQAKAAKQETVAARNIEQNEARITQYTEEAEGAEKIVAELTGSNGDTSAENNLPNREAHVAELKAQLEALGGDDPDRANLQIQLDEAEHAVSVLKDREIPYWQSVAEKSRARAEALRQEAVRYRNLHEDARTAVTQAAEAAQKQQEVLEQDAAARNAAAQETLNNERTL